MIPTAKDRKQLVLVALFVFSLFSLLIIQFYKIQIVEGDKWTKAANNQHQLAVIEPFKRGLFYSNTQLKGGHPEAQTPFVIDIPKFHLYADPKSIPEKYRVDIISKLKEILDLDSTAKLAAQFEKKSRSRKLVLWLSREMYDKVNQWWFPFAKTRKIPRNAIFFIQDYKRSYPFGKLLGQVLHTLREDQSIPTGGLEMVLNKYLKGEPGKRIILRSPRHPLDTGTVIREPQHGADVHLTINHALQAIAEEEIEKAVKNASAHGGWAVMMDPHSGEILALAQYPFFDPVAYKDFFNDPKLEQDTKVKVLTDPYEPGSTMKPITLAICLKANNELKKQGKAPLFSPQDKIATSACTFPGRGKILKDTHAHRFLNMNMGLQKSSNVYMAKMIQRVIERLGDDWYRKTLHEVFGFGEKTGIELPAESSGLLPTPGKKHPNGALEWSKPTPYSLAMGHNILVNGLQMLRCYSIFANGGYDVKPTLIRKIVRGQEILLDHTQANQVKTSLLEPEIVREVVTAMKYATKTGGTAPKADVPGYTEAGKTGTSEKIVNGAYSKKNHISTFIGFAPAKDAKIALFIAIDEPECKFIPGVGKNQMAGTCAAPAFREIAWRTLQYLGVTPDDPENLDWKDKVKQLKELYKQWN